MKDDTGYGEGDYTPIGPEPTDVIEWNVERTERFFTTGSNIILTITRNGTPCGMVNVRSEAEYEWIRKHFPGTQSLVEGEARRGGSGVGSPPNPRGFGDATAR